MKMARAVAACVTLLLGLAATVSADVPTQMSYQGRLTDDTGLPVPDGDYNITFQIHEHDPVVMGEPLLWSSGMVPISVTDGLFVYYLGSTVPLPASVFADDGLESHYLRFALEGSVVYSRGVKLASVPFAFKATHADTAAYAHAGPGGGGANGWVDDGPTVRLESGSNKVGIGVTSPEEKLVVGSTNIGPGSLDDEDLYIAVGNGYHMGYSGYKLGYDANNWARMKWYGIGEELTFDTRSLGVNYINTLVLKQGKVGINNISPNEPLSIGPDLGASFGDLITIARTGTNRYSGIMMGEDEENKANIIWYNNDNELRLQTESNNTGYGSTLVLKDGDVILGGTGDASLQLGEGAVNAAEMLNEPGIGRAAQGHEVVLPDGGWTTICERTCTFPTSGYAVVLVTADLRVNDRDVHVQLGVTNNSTVAPHLYTRFVHNDDQSSWENKDVMSLHEVFSVDAGANTFSFVGLSVTTLYHGVIYATSMTVMFFPTSYGTVNAVAGIEGKRPDLTSTAQPVLFTSESLPHAHDSAVDQQEQVSDLRREFEAELQALREEIAELKGDR